MTSLPTELSSAALATLGEFWHTHTGQPPPYAGDDDFFLSGGDSISAIQMLVAVTRRCGVDLEVDKFFAHPTFGTLRGLVESASAEHKG